jgi:hypothetical protein
MAVTYVEFSFVRINQKALQCITNDLFDPDLFQEESQRGRFPASNKTWISLIEPHQVHSTVVLGELS